MTPIKWVPFAAIHDRQIARHGGLPGVRDLTLLEAGAARPQNHSAYGDADPAALAAAYCFGIAKAHGFIDGNKRTGLVTALTFLRLNGYAFRPDPAQGLEMVEGLAAGDVSEIAFANWLSNGMTRI